MRPLIFVLCVAGLTLSLILPGCTHPKNIAVASDPDMGKTRFETYCAGCHLNEGQWMRGEAPPFEGSTWVSGPENRLIRIALHGLRGKIEVSDKTYNQEMPGFEPVLSDADIALLLSHLRKRFGVVAAPIPPEAVARVRDSTRGRKALWTADELLKIP